MKRAPFGVFSAAIICGIFVFLSISCSHGKENSFSPVGTWKELNNDYWYVYNSDGTGFVQSNAIKIPLKWEIVGDKQFRDYIFVSARVSEDKLYCFNDLSQEVFEKKSDDNTKWGRTVDNNYCIELNQDKTGKIINSDIITTISWNESCQDFIELYLPTFEKIDGITYFNKINNLFYRWNGCRFISDAYESNQIPETVFNEIYIEKNDFASDRILGKRTGKEYSKKIYKCNFSCPNGDIAFSIKCFNKIFKSNDEIEDSTNGDILKRIIIELE